MEGHLLLYVSTPIFDRPRHICCHIPGFWMSDKPLVQQALAGELAELILTITDVPSSLNFLRGFWTMTVREWSGIDRLRCVWCTL